MGFGMNSLSDAYCQFHHVSHFHCFSFYDLFLRIEAIQGQTPPRDHPPREQND